MRNTIFISTLLILAGLSSCKEECKTCPEGYGLVNGECECLGYMNGGECYTFDQLLEPNVFLFEGDLYYSFDPNSSDNFTFNSHPQLISIDGWAETGFWTESSRIGLVENRNASNYRNVAWKTTVQRFKNQDSAWFEPYRNEKGFGTTLGNQLTKLIDGKTCYLRPYLVQLDKGLYRVHLKWETAGGEVVDICTKIFRR